MGTVWVGFVLVYLLQFLAWCALELLNRSHLRKRGDRIPDPFQETIDLPALRRIRDYTLDKDRLGVREKIVTDLTLIGMILFGFLPLLDRGLSDLGLYPVLAGVSFFAAIGIIFRFLSLPFDYIHTFVIEEKYGFNRSTLRLWLSDLFKEGLISLVLLVILLLPLLWLIRVSPDHWWIWGFLVVSFVQILLVGLYPVLVAPLFNKFEPFEDPELGPRITQLMEGAGIRVKAILRMDAGKRSRHTNAYFTGLGKTKRIVLFDTLIHSHPSDEILAVLAHEAGHLKGRHILKQILLSEAALLVLFYLTHRLMGWPELYSAFGFEASHPHLGLFLLGIFWQRLGFFAMPLGMTLSRRFERQADRFAAMLMKTPQPLIASLKRLAVENLSNLNPYPLYVLFHYSHPPLVERIERLEAMGRNARAVNVKRLIP